MARRNLSRKAARRTASRTHRIHSAAENFRQRRLRYEPLEDRRVLATFTVNTDLDVVDPDDGLTALREAIVASNELEGADTIEFDFGHDGPARILLTEGQLEIRDSLTIHGAGPDLLTIDAGHGADGVPATGDGFRVFEIENLTDFDTPLKDVSLHGLTVTGGDLSGIDDVHPRGGGIYSSEQLTLVDVRVAHNTVSGVDSFLLQGGGGIFQLGLDGATLTIIDSQLNDNSVFGAESNGGGIALRASAEIVNSEISQNILESGNGGGISTTGGALTITITGSSIAHNAINPTHQPERAGSGGGIYSQGRIVMNLKDSLVLANSVFADYFATGGGISARFGAGSLTLNNCLVSKNSIVGTDEWSVTSGGGVFSNSRDTIINKSEIVGNTASEIGGVSVGGRLVVVDSTIRENSTTGYWGHAGGLFVISADASIIRTTIADNKTAGVWGFGGGLYAHSSRLSLLDSAVLGNSTTGESADGGGIYLFESVSSTILNTTVSNNSTASRGGGVFVQGSPTSIRHSTVTANNALTGEGSGVAVSGENDEFTALYATIIAGNSNMDIDILNGQGIHLKSLGYNIIGTGTSTDVFVQEGDEVLGTDSPGLAPLADNGGPTKTHALLPGSPALDAGDPDFDLFDPDGNPATVDSLLFDQRGAPFRRVALGRSSGIATMDIGAYESQGEPMFHPADFNQNGQVDMADYTVWRDMFGQMQVAASVPGDASGDGEVTWDDYELWKTNYGAGLLFGTAAGGSSSSSSSSSSLSSDISGEVINPTPIPTSQLTDAENTSRTASAKGQHDRASARPNVRAVDRALELLLTRRQQANEERSDYKSPIAAEFNESWGRFPTCQGDAASYISAQTRVNDLAG